MKFFKIFSSIIVVGIIFCTNTTVVAKIDNDFYDNDAIYAQNTPDISAVSAVLINADTSEILFAKNEVEKRAMASTTKIMTAILTLEAGDLDKKFTVDNYAIKVEGTSMGLREGDIVTRRALVHGMLLPSGNDATNAAAVNISGSIEKFVKLMNDKAKELGLNDTAFVTPSGLDASGHYTTAIDLANLTAYALKSEEFRKICSQQSLKTEFGNPVSTKWMKNSNKMLASYKGCIGVKTGFTDNAKRCLVSAAERDGVTLIAVTLNAPDDWRDHTSMLDFGFSQYERIEVSFDDSNLSIPVVGAKLDVAKITADKDIQLTVQKKYKEQIRTRLLLPKFIYAGFDEGKEIGKVQYIANGNIIAEFPMKTGESVDINTEKSSLWEKFLRLFSKKN